MRSVGGHDARSPVPSVYDNQHQTALLPCDEHELITKDGY